MASTRDVELTLLTTSESRTERFRVVSLVGIQTRAAELTSPPDVGARS